MTANSDHSRAVDEVLQQLHAGSSMPAELVEIFAEEAEDHLRVIYNGLDQLKNDSGNVTALAEVRRSAHTLKGAAGAVNLQAATRLAHRMEDLLDRLANRNEQVTKSQLNLLLSTADKLQELTAGQFQADSLAPQIADLYAQYTSEMGAAERPGASPSPDKTHQPAHSPTAERNPAQPPKSSGQNEATSADQFLRVPVHRLDDLVALLGEMIVNRSEFQNRLEDFESRIDDMHSALERLRNVVHFVETHQTDQLANVGGANPIGPTQTTQRSFVPTAARRFQQPGSQGEFDPLEFERYTESHLLAQTLAEADNDAEIMSGEFRNVKSAFDSLLRRQQQLNRDAQQSLMRIRMVPLSGIISRLERTVRTVAAKLGRNVELEVIGQHIELDKTVLDEITDPLLHLIRNGIDHGVEDPQVRATAGKPETARLAITAVNQGSQISIRVCDDGAGINLDKVRQKAIQQNLISPDQELTSHELHALIFKPGFSTAAQLTDVSGRGVGLDVVADAIGRLNGSIRVDSEPGKGTTFAIQIPTKLGVSRAVTVESGGRSFALPLQSIRQIVRLDKSRATMSDDTPTVSFGSQSARLVDLASHLNLVPEQTVPAFKDGSPMIVLGDGDETVALTVDKILGSRDIVVKSLGNHLKKVRWFAGATIDGNGIVVPVLDTAELILNRSTDLLSVSGSREASTPVIRRELAMVVDDSISVRRINESLLRSVGWDVVTANDGVDALEKLAQLDKAPDIFLCDMEMPRMDGLELIRQIREQEEFESTPIIMITSRGSEKHRHKAYEAGATDYVVKPFNRDELLELVAELAQSARETVAS
jgi:chemosensory pili system protein ChpA (sensor histidine kinase/response regulator)